MRWQKARVIEVHRDDNIHITKKSVIGKTLWIDSKSLIHADHGYFENANGSRSERVDFSTDQRIARTNLLAPSGSHYWLPLCILELLPEFCENPEFQKETEWLIQHLKQRQRRT